jgi:predicted enzyme related to lactoylglutathione lyase
MPCTDPSRAMAFYKTVFGGMYHCDVQEPLPGYMDGVDNVTMFYTYTLYGAFVKMTKPEGVATVADSNDLAKIPLLPSFRVDNVDDTLGVVEKNGGKVHL